MAGPQAGGSKSTTESKVHPSGIVSWRPSAETSSSPSLYIITVTSTSQSGAYAGGENERQAVKSRSTRMLTHTVSGSQ